MVLPLSHSLLNCLPAVFMSSVFIRTEIMAGLHKNITQLYQNLKPGLTVGWKGFTCWLTRQCECPWWMRMRTMSTSPRQAARCSGKHPLLSAKFVDASNCNSFITTSLRKTEPYIYRSMYNINCMKDETELCAKA